MKKINNLDFFEYIAIAHEPITHKLITALEKNKNKNNSLGRSRCDWQCAIATVYK